MVAAAMFALTVASPCLVDPHCIAVVVGAVILSTVVVVRVLAAPALGIAFVAQPLTL